MNDLLSIIISSADSRAIAWDAHMDAATDYTWQLKKPNE